MQSRKPKPNDGDHTPAIVMAPRLPRAVRSTHPYGAKPHMRSLTGRAGDNPYPAHTPKKGVNFNQALSVVRSTFTPAPIEELTATFFT